MRDRTRIPALLVQILNYWTDRKSPSHFMFSEDVIYSEATLVEILETLTLPPPHSSPFSGTCTKEGLTVTLRLPELTPPCGRKAFPLDILPPTPTHSSLLVPFFCWAVILHFQLAIK